MSQGKSSARPPSTTRRNCSPFYHEPGSTSSTTATAPLRMQLRLLRGSRPPSRTTRTSTSSAFYSTRSRSPGSTNEPTTAPMMTTTPTGTLPASRQPQLGSPSMRGISRTPPSPADETLTNCPNQSDAAPTGGHYSPPSTM